MKKLFFVLIVLFSFCQMAAAQALKNGNFSLPVGTTSTNNWLFAPSPLTPESTTTNNNNNTWIDLTPINSATPLWGNGAWMEQKVFLSACKNYSVTLDLGSYYAWNIYDAGVTLSVDGQAIGNRIFNNTFSTVANPLLWQTKTSAQFTIATAGMHTIRLTGNGSLVKFFTRDYADAPGVIAIDNVKLDSFAVAPSTTTITGNLNICAGASTILTAGAGSSYKWSNNANNATTQSITASAAGIYSVTVTNASGCTAVTSATVVVNQLPVVTITGNTPGCGAIKTVLTATGGGTYKWSTNPIATTAAIAVGTSGNYTVTVTSAAGCVTTKTVNVSFLAPPVISLVSQKVSCEGTTNIVSIDITPSGGTAPYTYSWSNGAATQDLVNVVGNVSSYCVVVTDAKGCQTKRCFECISPCSTNPSILPDYPLPFMAPTATALNTTQEEKSNVESSPVEQAQTEVSKKAEVKTEDKPTVKKSVVITKSTGVKILGVVVGGSLVNFIIQKLNTPKSLPKLK